MTLFSIVSFFKIKWLQPPKLISLHKWATTRSLETLI